MTTAFDPETARPGVPHPARGGLRAGHRALEPPPGADAAGAIRRNAVGRGASEMYGGASYAIAPRARACWRLRRGPVAGLCRLNGQPVIVLEF